jgi:hypothetical protein
MDMEGEDPILPSDRLVVDVMNAGAGASEQEVMECLGYFFNERGLRPGSRHGPRYFKWFITTVGDYFAQKHQREGVWRPDAKQSQDRMMSRADEKAEFDRMTEAIEIG